MALAQIQEKQGTWDEAYETWDSLCKMAQDSSIREVAEASRARTNDERITSRLIRGENLANAGDFDGALSPLLGAVDLNPSPRMFDRIRNRYFDVLGRWCADRISSLTARQGWKSISVGEFTGGSDSEGRFIRDRIYSVLAASKIGNPGIVSLSDAAIRDLADGSIAGSLEPVIAEYDRAGIDALIFGTIQGQLSAYLFEIKGRRAHVLLTAPLLGSVPGFPTNIEAWAQLPNKNTSSHAMRVEVWTDQPSYRVEDDLVFHFRSHRDCYVTLVDVQPSGGVSMVFPNRAQEDNYVQANVDRMIPAPQDSFSFKVKGPAGVEGVKAIATTNPTTNALLRKTLSNVAARTRKKQADLYGQLQSTMKNLGSDEWDVAEWTFEIKQR